MIRFGPSKYDIAVVYEALAISQLANAQGRWGNLNIYYPATTIWSDHPIAVLQADWVTPAQKAAARQWIDFLRSRPTQEKALAYGFPGLQVDGNDLLAVYAATREAVARARAGDGPTLIECVTYRLSMHTTADDPTKYRSEEEVAAWERKDPLTRMRAYMEKKGLLDAGVEEAVDAEIAGALARFEATPPADPLVAFDHVFAARPPGLEAQRAEMAQRLRAGAPAPPGGGAAPAATPMRGQRATRR